MGALKYEEEGHEADFDKEFLDWCIDNSFEYKEMYGMTEKRLKRYKAAVPHLLDNKSIQIHAFKRMVEFNFAIKLGKYALVFIVCFAVGRFLL